ncbi:MAG: hypothetical protein HYX69_10815 [Planctomycetia bacterium]|nr:hypothetical protein [Planctomycetia bacterium]
MNLRRLACVLGVCVLVVGLGSTANAQWGWGGGGGLYSYGYGMPYSAYVLDAPPYFAMFPPVYYSHITPRPYGYSPFAYPPGIMTPERVPSRSTQWNGYARRRVTNKAATVQTVSKPVTIKNPFVLPESERPKRLADGRRVPQTVSLAAASSASTP